MKTKSTFLKAPRSFLTCLNFGALILSVLCWCAPSFATITINGITNVSNKTGLGLTTSAGTASASATPSSTQGAIFVYGGTAGSADTCAPRSDGQQLCDNCSNSQGLYDCNFNRITPGIAITVTFVSSSADGVPGVSIVNSGTNVATAVPLQNATTTQVGKNNVTQAVFTWGSICGSMVDAGGTVAAGSDCTSTVPSTAILRIGILVGGDTVMGSSDDYAQVTFTVSGVLADGHTNSTSTGTGSQITHYAYPCNNSAAVGICSFSMYPGDGKATIRDVNALNGFPTGIGGLGFQGAQLFYMPGKITDNLAFTTAGGHSGIFAAASNGNNLPSLSPADVTGLTNETLYSFKAASVDLAGNVSFFTADAAQGDTYCALSLSPISTTDGFCHEALPGAVYGTLGKTMNCFIATAAYGSPMAPQVDAFRQFRNRFLLGNSLGKSFVRFYYDHSPKYAKIIAESETLRAMARFALWPLLAFVSLTLHFGFINAMIMLLAVFVLPLAIYILRQSRGARA